MKYMMFVCVDPNAEPYDPKFDNIAQWVQENDSSLVRQHGDRLAEVKDAKTVRVRKNEVLVTDGPFAETKEWIAGYDVLECADLDEAIRIASRHPMARFGRIEVRPFWHLEL